MTSILQEVKVELDKQPQLTITSIKIDMDNNSSSTDTNRGTVKSPNTASGGKVSIDALEYPDSVQDLVNFENYLAKGIVDAATFSSIGKARDGGKYRRIVTCLGGFIVPSSEWKSGDGLTVSFECEFDTITQESKPL